MITKDVMHVWLGGSRRILLLNKTQLIKLVICGGRLRGYTRWRVVRSSDHPSTLNIRTNTPSSEHCFVLLNSADAGDIIIKEEVLIVAADSLLKY